MRKATLTVMALAMITASVKAGWQYKDVQDEMGRDAPEHHAFVLSKRDDANLVLARFADGTQAVIIYVKTGMLNGESLQGSSKLYYVPISVRLDDGQIFQASLRMMPELGMDNGSLGVEQSDSLIKWLLVSSTLRIEVPIYGHSSVVYTFDVAGLKW